MADKGSSEERTRVLFDEKLKEFAAFDRTLDALAALRFILEFVKEISEETTAYDFRPRLAPQGPDKDPYTPDGIVWQKPSISFLLELKTSWNNDDVVQIVKYGRTKSALLQDGVRRTFADKHCVLLGYQNPPGDANLDSLFAEWAEESIPSPLVVFRYSLEDAPAGQRIVFARLAHDRNGRCPSSSLGHALNSARGYTVSANSFKRVRTKFHKANDQVIDSYAAVLWWTKYAKHYLTEDQKSEMAASGRLSSPLRIPLDRLDQVPRLPDVEVPLTAKDIKRGLDFLRHAGLVSLNTHAGTYEIKLKEDRYLRFPRPTALSEELPSHDTKVKIIMRWANNKVRHPAKVRPGAKKPKPRRRSTRDLYSGNLFQDTEQ